MRKGHHKLFLFFITSASSTYNIIFLQNLQKDEKDVDFNRKTQNMCTFFQVNLFLSNRQINNDKWKLSTYLVLVGAVVCGSGFSWCCSVLKNLSKHFSTNTSRHFLFITVYLSAVWKSGLPREFGLVLCCLFKSSLLFDLLCPHSWLGIKITLSLLHHLLCVSILLHTCLPPSPPFVCFHLTSHLFTSFTTFYVFSSYFTPIYLLHHLLCVFILLHNTSSQLCFIFYLKKMYHLHLPAWSGYFNITHQHHLHNCIIYICEHNLYTST